MTLLKTKHRLIFYLCLCFSLLLTAAQTEPPVVYESWDVAIDLLGNGEYVVTETQRIRFNGEFSSGFAEIPREFTEDIYNVTVADEDGAYRRGGSGPGTYSVDKDSAFIYVDWSFPTVQAGDVRTFFITYQVKGGLAYYASETRLDWEIIPADRGGLPIESAAFSLTFPPDSVVDPAAVTFDSDLAEVAQRVETEAETTEPLRVVVAELIADGTPWRAVVTFPPDIIAGTPPPWQQRRDAATLVYNYNAINTDLVIAADGTLHITERQDLSVISGATGHGFRFFELAQLDAIRDVQIFEGADVFGADDSSGCYYCFTVETTPRGANWVYFARSDYSLYFDEDEFGRTDINWYFPSLIDGDRTEFELQYTVEGALAVNEENQRLSWTVIPGYNMTVAAATVHLTLPPGVSREEVVIDAPEAVLQPQADGTILIERQAPVYEDSTWAITIYLPPGATSASAPGWQRDLEAAVAAAQVAQQEDIEAERRRAQQQLLVGAGAILLGLGGLLSVLLIWYLRGRDAPLTDLVAEYITEPPSDLAPGLVAFLLDEGPSPQGVLANIFQLATLGLVQINLKRQGKSLSLRRNWSEPLEPGQTIETPAGDEVVVPDYLVTLFNNLEPDKDKWNDNVYISTAWGHLKPLLPTIYAEMRQGSAGFFAGQPEKARHRWQVIGQVIFLLGIAGLVAAFFYGWRLGPVSYWPPTALMVTGLALAGISRWMPRRTEAGAVEAARWQAFKRYLKDLQQRGDLPAAQAILDQHFAYVVALGLADVVIKETAEMGARLPTWSDQRPLVWLDQPDETTPTTTSGRRPLRRRDPQPIGETSGRGLAESGAGGLQGLSNTFTSQINNASRDLTRVLNSAIGDANDTPFELIVHGATETAKFTWKASTTTAKVVFEVVEAMESSSGGGGGGFSSGSSSRSYRSSSSSRRSSSSSSRSRSSSRSSGGRRGFR